MRCGGSFVTQVVPLNLRVFIIKAMWREIIGFGVGCYDHKNAVFCFLFFLLSCPPVPVC